MMGMLRMYSLKLTFTLNLYLYALVAQFDDGNSTALQTGIDGCAALCGCCP